MMTVLSDIYNGFTILDPVGNNLLSYKQREQQEIYVAPFLETATLDDLHVGERVVFSECEEGVEHNQVGLRNFLYLKYNEKHIFIFDNHNHALFLWAWSIHKGYIPRGLACVHVDQHKDMRDPGVYLSQEDFSDLRKVFQYTNFEVNVGNFIKPALNVGLISDVVMIDHEEAFNQSVPDEYILDIDIDIFSDQMNYIDNFLKLKCIKEYIKKASVITVATSPYFIDQYKAIDYIKLLFNDV